MQTTGEGSRLRRRRERQRRLLGQGLAIVVAVACLLAVGRSVLGAASETAGSRGTQVASRAEVVLLPVIGAGEGGWCMTTRGTIGCPTIHTPTFRGPIVVEDWSAHSPPPIDEGIVLTTSEVVAVSLEGGAPVPTRAESVLPDRLRAAIIELHGGSGRKAVGIPLPLAFPHAHFVAWNSKGQQIPRTGAVASPLSFALPTQSWQPGESSRPGICGVDVSGVPGLIFTGGSALTTVTPHMDVRGREFVDCVRMSYTLGTWPLEVDVLIDAARPGSAPGPIALMRPVAGRRGVYEGSGVDGEMVARRIPGAWLLVGKGDGRRQRLELLDHVHTHLHL
jgi:hypothetical protein